MEQREMAMRALDMFCRNATGQIVDGTINPITGNRSKEFFPTKNRCGSNDPVDMKPETQCECKVMDKTTTCLQPFTFLFPLPRFRSPRTTLGPRTESG